jgi:cytochrome P450
MKVDLLDPAGYVSGQPFDEMLWLQEHEPVHWHEERSGGPGFWALTRFKDIREVQGNPEVFSNSPTVVIADDYVFADGLHDNMMFTDPPRHTQRRRFLGQELFPQSVRQLTGRVQGVVDDVLDDVIERGECDLVSDIAGKLASYVTAEVMGLPREDAVEMYELADLIINSDSPNSGPGMEAMAKLGEYSQKTWEDRRGCPREDMLTRMAHADVDGWPDDAHQFALDFMLIFNAAGDTTRNVVSGGMDAMFAHRDQWERLTRDPGLVPGAVEEMLRWVTPIVYQRRTVQDDTQIAGQPIRAGQKVASFFGAANRDPAVFDDPLRFDIRRAPNNHMAFGFGPHFCLGSHLARLELRLMFAALAQRLPDIEPTEPTRWVRTDFNATVAPIVVGPQAMPARFTPGRAVGRDDVA